MIRRTLTKALTLVAVTCLSGVATAQSGEKMDAAIEKATYLINAGERYAKAGRREAAEKVFRQAEEILNSVNRKKAQPRRRSVVLRGEAAKPRVKEAAAKKKAAAKQKAAAKKIAIAKQKAAANRAEAAAKKASAKRAVDHKKRKDDPRRKESKRKIRSRKLQPRRPATPPAPARPATPSRRSFGVRRSKPSGNEAELNNRIKKLEQEIKALESALKRFDRAARARKIV